MRKLYREFFYVPKHGKVGEKVMATRIFTTAAVIVLCLIAMGTTAYAYFSYNLASANNKIQSANFGVDVDIQVTDGEGASVEVTPGLGNAHIADLKAGTEYLVTLTPAQTGRATTGFVIVTAEGFSARYHTQQLGKNGEENTESLSFNLIVGADAQVTFQAHWGTSSYYGYENDNAEKYITQGETVRIFGAFEQGEQAGGVHIVALGEYLSQIAELYDTTVERLVAYNNIVDPDSIDVGQIIKIPPASWEPSASQSVPSAPQQESSASQQEEPEDELLGTAPLLPVNPSNTDTTNNLGE